MNTGRYYSGSAGTSNTAALVFGGEIPPASALTEIWNGTNWTEVGDLNTARLTTGAGTTTAAIAMGGRVPPNTAVTELWNGTNWTAVASMGTARYATAPAGTTAAALVSGGTAPTDGGLTEEWNDPGIITKTLTT